MFEEWIGLGQQISDWITPAKVARWHATLDHDVAPPRDGAPVAPGFHWTIAQPIARESELGPDGHLKRGTFLPPIQLPRRLWAGSRVTFQRALRVGERVERISKIASISEKTGRDSPLVFVTVHHQLVGEDGVAIEEDQDLVYRGESSAGGRGRDNTDEIRKAEWQRVIRPTETLLFRYSAVTFNTHRIHYDRRYAVETEGYPGLVVHGPLIATLLLDLMQTQVAAERVERFQFRAIRPTFDTSDFAVCGSASEKGRFVLWSTDNSGAVAVDAEGSFN